MKRLSTLFLLTLLAVSIYAASDNSQQLSVRQTFLQSADISLSQIAACRNIAISGQCQINHNGQKSLFRAILVDENGEEYLVAEFNDLISSEQQVSFNSRCDETTFSSSVKPAKLKIIVVNAQATIDNVTYDNNASATRGSAEIAAAKSTRIANEIALYNQAIQREGMLWIAGETSLSNLTYSQKKELFGATSDSCCWYGFEHYKGGIFCTPSYLANRERSNTTSQYVPNFTWQRRHGINWNTSVKDQKFPVQPNSIGNGGCWAFSPIALAEVYSNIYYNQKIDLDLSEQQVISCSGGGNCYANGTDRGGIDHLALEYIIDNGVTSEQFFPFVNFDDDCEHMDPNATTAYSGGQIIFKWPKATNMSTNTVIYYLNADSVKKFLINYGPQAASLNNYAETNHDLLLVGYGQITADDSVQYFGHYTNLSPIPIHIPNGSPYIGETYWAFKNSYGENHGFNGYVYCLLEDFYLMGGYHCITGQPNVEGYDENDIVCEDRDGDGYYNWGIGPKPSYCPPCPDLPDGNDRNPNVGGMNTFGFSTYLGNPNAAPCIVGDDAIGCNGKFSVMNITDDIDVQWTIEGVTNTCKPLIIVGPSTEALLEVRQGVNMNMSHISSYTGYATIKATLSSNGSPIILTKTIYVTGHKTPNVNTQNMVSPMVGRNRTFTETNCTNIPAQYLKWDVTVPGVGHLTLFGHSITVCPTTTGTLRVTVTNLIACDEANSSFSFSCSVVGGHIVLGTNPADSYLEYEIVEDVSASRTNYTVDIYNSNGLRMESTAVRNADGVKQVNTSSYLDGYYTIRLLDNGTLIDSKNFIVKH